jgi:hypothetical protein
MFLFAPNHIYRYASRQTLESNQFISIYSLCHITVTYLTLMPTYIEILHI